MKPFDEFMEPLFPRSMRSFFSDFNKREPSFDIQDRGDKFVVTAELPGFGKDDVEVRVNPTSLELKAEKTDEVKKEADGTQAGNPTPTSSDTSHCLNRHDRESRRDYENGVLELNSQERGRKLEEKPRRVDLK